MLAKELKIQSLKRQREFIESVFEKMLRNPPENGDITFMYYGKIFPENISYFKENGFDVSCFTADSATNNRCQIPNSYPMYCFSISDDIVLTNEEMERAENVKYQPPESDTSLEYAVELLNQLIPELNFKNI